MSWKWAVFIALISYGAYQSYSNRPVTHGVGIIASQQPQQNSTGFADFNHNGYKIVPLQTFEIEARVLATKKYSSGRESDLAPVDLALGWGAMSDEVVLKDISISQSGRFYYWRVDRFPIPRKDIETQSANMHMVPANSQIESTLKSIRPGQVVKLSGYLIEITANDGWRWKSSLTREDTGNGACEIVYVKALEVS